MNRSEKLIFEERCDDPLKHPFEPNGDGHSHFQDLCWWCGKDEAAHKKKVTP